VSDQAAAKQAEKPTQRAWWTLIALCMAELMIVLDTTIVNVALPSIQSDLHFSEAALVWVVNAYMLTFGGCLLLGGRLGDLYGHRTIFLIGLFSFTAASWLCGIANSQDTLIAARALQGLGGAVTSAIALSLIMNVFSEPAARAKAMGVYGFVCAGGGSVGAFLGGVLVDRFSWHSIFLVNLPIGVLVFAACARLLSKPGLQKTADDAKTAHDAASADTAVQAHKPRLDWFGAISITLALMLAVYAIVNGNQVGWGSFTTLLQLGTSVCLLLIFIGWEARLEKAAAQPLMPLSLFRIRNLWVSNLIAVLWAAAMFAWFFISALYMQLILHYSPLQVGLAFVPANLIMAAFSLGLSDKLVMRFGKIKPLVFGLSMASLGLICFALAPIQGQFSLHVLPGMLLLGLGCGIAFNPMLLVAMSDVKESDSGLASGLVNTSFMMGGALGLALLASLAAAQSSGFASVTNMKVGTSAEAANMAAAALHHGYAWAFAGGALMGLLAALLAACMLKTTITPAQTPTPLH
jgi:MFS family permease